MLDIRFSDFRSLEKLAFIGNGVFLFWYFSASVIGYKSPAMFYFLLMSIFTMFSFVKVPKEIWESQKYWMAGLFCFGMFNIVFLMFQGVELSGAYERPAKALVAILVFLYLLHYRFSDKTVAAGIVVAAFVGGGYAIYERFFLDLPRAGTLTNPIRYGYLVLVAGLLCVFYMSIFRSFLSRIFFLVPASVALFGAYCTGTRGVFVIVVFLLLFLMFQAIKNNRDSAKYMVPLTLGVVLIFGLLAVKTNVFERYIDDTVKEFERIDSGDLSSSIGIRFQMWHVALYLGGQEPFSGVGFDYDEIREKAKNFIDGNGYDRKILTDYGHFHNQYLDLFAKQGLPGLYAWCFLLIAALVGMKSRYKYAVLIIVVTLAVGGLTEAVFRSSRLFYLTILGISVFRCLDYFEVKKLAGPVTETR